MTSSTENKPAQPPAKRLATALLVLDRGGRLAVIAVICWLAWSLLGSLGWLTGEPEAPEPAAAPAALPSPAPLLSDFTSGHWSFSGVSWNVSVSQLDAAATTAFLMAEPAVNSAVSLDQGTTARLKGLLREFDATPARRGVWDVYRLDKPTFRAAAFFKGSANQLTLGAARVAYTTDSKHWSGVDFIPGESTGRGKQASLLPWGAQATPLATRFDQQGRAIGEFVEIRGPLAGAMDLWEQDGWNVTEAPGSEGSQVQWVCVRRSEAIYVWVADLSAGGEKMLIVSRMPEG